MALFHPLSTNEEVPKKNSDTHEDFAKTRIFSLCSSIFRYVNCESLPKCSQNIQGTQVQSFANEKDCTAVSLTFCEHLGADNRLKGDLLFLQLEVVTYYK